MTINFSYPRLNERQRAVFGALVEEYTFGAKAIGSKLLAQRISLGLASASIRNVMSELEEMGFLYREHTSAGRIPTDFGYAYYIDNMIQHIEVPGIHQFAINSTLNQALKGGINELLKKTGIALSNISMLFSIVLAPRTIMGTILKIDLIRIASKRILVVWTLDGGFQEKILIEIDPEVSNDDIGELNLLINEKLSGFKLSEIKSGMEYIYSATSEGLRQIVGRVADAAEYPFYDDDTEIIHAGGSQYIAMQPEFANSEKIGVLFKIIEDPRLIAEAFKNADHKSYEGVRIGIGSELENDQMLGYSVVSTKYTVGELEGRLGIIGPTRMPYSQLASLLNFTSLAIKQKMVA